MRILSMSYTESVGVPSHARDPRQRFEIVADAKIIARRRTDIPGESNASYRTVPRPRCLETESRAFYASHLARRAPHTAYSAARSTPKPKFSPDSPRRIRNDVSHIDPYSHLILWHDSVRKCTFEYLHWEKSVGSKKHSPVQLYATGYRANIC